MEKTSFATKDGAKIAANYWPGVSEMGIVLLHMMPATKESWTKLAEKLQAEGFDVVAIDLRGHGESLEMRSEGLARKLDYRQFEDEEHQASVKDVAAAVKFLVERGIDKGSIFVGGASIGANLAMLYMAEHPACTTGFALSPGLDYHGLDGAEIADRLDTNQRLFIAAAKDDENTDDAAGQAERIYDAMGGERELKVLERGGHGTDMLEANPELLDGLVVWLTAETQ